MTDQPTWTIRGRGEHHVPELDGPYLAHNVTLTLEEVCVPESFHSDAQQLQLWSAVRHQI